MAAVLRTLLLLLVLLVATLAASVPDTENKSPRTARTFGFFSSLFDWGSNCGSCPSHHCQHDDAVLHGYCCGCAKLLDSTPLTCPPDLQCPLDGRQLCRDYDYMMDCCC